MGINIIRPFPEATGKVKFLVVAIHYYTKWVEAEPLVMVTGKNIIKFFWKQISFRFRIPHTLISDNNT